MSEQSHVERLRAAGVLSDNDDHLEEHHHEAINSLTEEEVQALISVHQKVGSIEVGEHEKGRAWFV